MTQNTAMHYVIIGGGAAGVAAATKLRMLSPQCIITCITKEPFLPYNRCALADFLVGNKKIEQVFLKTQEQWDKLGVHLLINTSVEAIDTKKQTVTTNTGQCISYDTLLLAPGKRASRPELVGVEAQGIFDFFTLGHVQAIKNFIEKHKPKNVVVVGGGFIGLECADALKNLGLHVTVVERKTSLLPWQISSQASTMLFDLLKKNNIHVCVGSSVERFVQENGIVVAVQLEDGHTISADMVVVACGGSINNELAIGCGLELSQHCVVVDEYMRTNVPTIFAAGDVCLIKDVASHCLRPNYLWADAVVQGLAAGSNMAGVQTVYKGSVFITNLRVCNTSIMVGGFEIGLIGSYKKMEVIGQQFSHTYFFDDKDALKGFVLIGNVESVSHLREYMISGQPFKI